MMRKYASVSIFVLFLPFYIAAQQSTVYTEANVNFKKGLELFDLGVYSVAQDEFGKVLDKLAPVNEPEYRIIKKKAELYYARSAVRLEQPDGQKLMLDFVRRHRPDPTANKALLELADYYYNSRKYDQAIEFFAMMDQRGFTQSERTEIAFKHAYCLFVRKRYDEAKAKFATVLNTEGPNYYASNYYYGMSCFYGEDYDCAIKSWKIAEKDPLYRKSIPYYIAQVYFKQGDYQQVISASLPYADQRGVKNQAELNQLIGQAYFELGDYEQALTYLEYFEQNSRKLRVEDFYQLGFVQYKKGKYEESIQSFRELDREDSELGQSAMFYLANAYLQIGDRASARNAFQKVSRLPYDTEMQEEALFNFAKLSVELHFDRDAINALRRFQPTSKYYTDAQELLSETLVNTNDYRGAIKIIEGLPEQTPRIKEAYQKVTYYQGIQDYTGRNFNSALAYFEKSLSVPVDNTIKALATFWTGEIHHYQKKYGISKGDFSRFITLASSIGDLPPSSSLATGHYTQGYNYIKTDDYTNALKHFESCIEMIDGNRSVSPLLAKQVMPDALLRAGDCNFKRNRYRPALKHYDQAISLEAPGFEYAIFQKAVIQGLQGYPTAKLITLEQLVNNHPNAAYADDALLEMADTYQDLRQLQDALAPLERLVAQYRGKSDLINKAYLKLGLITYNLGDIEEALVHYKIIFKNNPSSQEAKDAMAAIEEIYVQDLGQPDEYVAFVESIPGYKVSGGERDSLNYQVAQRLYEAADYERAIQAFSDYLDKYPRGFHVLDAYYNRAESYSILKQFDEANADYEYVIERGQSRYYQPSLEKAGLISYNHAEDFEKAYQYFAKLELLTNDPQLKFEAQLYAMRSAYRSGKKSAASTYATKVMSNPSATKEELAVAQFYRGKISFEEKRYAEAMQLFQEVLENSNNENTAEARYLIANIHYLSRDIDLAERACRKSYSESGAYPYWVARSLILLSDILVEKQDYFNAKAALEAVIDNFTEDPALVEIAEAKVKAIEAEEARSNRIVNEQSTTSTTDEENN
ncbi:MAG: tetratricopeptide repeat protein [Saprospiraceae bacterium]|nr:tetratricopeptide repeat protein [Saprospiraceae bacterium]